MAKYQYRYAGELSWQSTSGNAIWAILNPQGSGKKLTLNAVEIATLTSTLSNSNFIFVAPSQFTLVRQAVSGGIEQTPVPYDTAAAAWPSTLRVLKRAFLQAALSTEHLQKFSLVRALYNSGLTSLGYFTQTSAKGYTRGPIRAANESAITESYVARAGETLALTCSVFPGSMTVRVSATIQVGAVTYQTSYMTALIQAQQVLFALDNTAGSGLNVSLKSLTIEEVGDATTPYLQLVPVGAIVEEQNTTQMPVFKLDTNYPSPAAWIKTYQDAAMLPFGVPENYLADSSIGSPKGFNYLKTKDFLGPVYKTYFPELVMARAADVTPDDFTTKAQRYADIGVSRAEITIREGEGIALVGAAETAASASIVVGSSGWTTLDFGITVSVEPATSPVLTLTGLKNPTEVRVYQAGTQTLLAGQEDVTSGTFSWNYDPDDVTSVDIAVVTLGFINIRLPAFALTSTSVTIPIQQQVDRQFLNP